MKCTGPGCEYEGPVEFWVPFCKRCPYGRADECDYSHTECTNECDPDEMTWSEYAGANREPTGSIARPNDYYARCPRCSDLVNDWGDARPEGLAK